LPLLLVKPANSGEPLRVSEAPVELNDIPATFTGLLGLPDAFDGKNVFAVKSGEERQRRYYREMSKRSRAARTGYFESLQEYIISGSVFRESSWQVGKIYSKPTAHRNRHYSWGTRLRFGTKGNVLPFLLDGWSVPGNNGTWTAAGTVSVGLEVDPPENDTVSLSATLFPFIVQDKLPSQRVLVRINDTPVGEWLLNERTLQTHSISVPATRFKENEVVIGFEFPDAASPKELGVSLDVRTLGAIVYDITLHDGDGP
jgi:hypothetical protein